MQRPPGQYAPLQGHSAYDVLGVEPDASHSEIDAARKRLVRRLHPDLPSGDAAKMSLVNIAAAILLDRARRADYDDYLASVGDDGPAGYDSAIYDSAIYDPEGDYDEDYGDRLVTRPAAPTRRPDPPTQRDPAPPSRRAQPQTRPGQPQTRPGHTRQPQTRQSQPQGQPQSQPQTRPGRAGPTRLPARSQTRRPTPTVDDDDDSIDRRLPLVWQPPPPGPLARWHTRRAEHRRIARARKPGPSRGPLVGLAFFVFLITLCAVGGVLLGYSAGGTGKPAPTQTTTPTRTPTRTPTKAPTKPPTKAPTTKPPTVKPSSQKPR